jgi:hypothetical protein
VLPDGRVGPVVVVLVDPCWQSREPGCLGVVELLKRLPLGQGAVEPFDLSVGLGAVGPLRCDAEVGTGLASQVRPIAAAVVGEHAVDGDAALGEPGHRMAQDLGGGLLGFVIMGLDVGDP